MKTPILVLLAGAALAGGLAATSASAAPPPSCFEANQVQGWQSTRGGTIYVRALNRVYRLDTTHCSPLLSAGAHIEVRGRGNDHICRPIDIDLRIQDRSGMNVSCQVTRVTPLTWAQAKALPSRLRP